MTPLVAQVTHFFSAGVLVFNILTIVGAALLFVPRFRQSSLFVTVGSKAILLAFLVALGATLGSMFYSSIAGFPPCNFCWYQRMFLFPQVLLLTIGLYKKDEHIVDYSLGFSILGALIAAYHYYGQMFNGSALPCPAGAVSCTKREFLEFGYITIPMMSLTVFALLILIMVYRKLHRNSMSLS